MSSAGMFVRGYRRPSAESHQPGSVNHSVRVDRLACARSWPGRWEAPRAAGARCGSGQL